VTLSSTPPAIKS